MIWRLRIGWTDPQGRRWRGEVDRAGLRWEPLFSELATLWSGPDGWSRSPGPLGPDAALAARSSGPRRLDLVDDSGGVAEVWAIPGAARWGRSPGAARAHRVLHQLRARGYPAPRPLGWFAPARGADVGFLVHGPVVGPSVAAWLRAEPRRDERRRLLAEGARLLRRMARDGLVHPGLDAERLRWAEAGLVLGDLEAVRFGPPGIRGLVLHVERLARDPALVDLQRLDRARFAWSVLRGRPGRRHWFRRLFARTSTFEEGALASVARR